MPKIFQDVNRTVRHAMIIGYARTSTADQTAGLAAQERDSAAAGAERIFAEQISSVAQRAGSGRVPGFLRDGDVLMVTKPDRLARSTAELLAIEARPVKARYRPGRAVAWAASGWTPAIRPAS